MKARNVKPGMLVQRGIRWHVAVDVQVDRTGWRQIVRGDGESIHLPPYGDVQAARLTDAQTFALRLIGTGTVKLSGTRYVDDEHWQPLRSEPIQRLQVYGLVDLDGAKGAYHRPVALTRAGRVLLGLLDAKETSDA